MATKKTTKKGAEKPAKKQGIKLLKLSSLSKAKLAKVNVDDLWIMVAPPAKLRARYCSCRNVCIV